MRRAFFIALQALASYATTVETDSLGDSLLSLLRRSTQAGAAGAGANCRIGELPALVFPAWSSGRCLPSSHSSTGAGTSGSTFGREGFRVSPLGAPTLSTQKSNIELEHALFPVALLGRRLRAKNF